MFSRETNLCLFFFKKNILLRGYPEVTRGYPVVTPRFLLKEKKEFFDFTVGPFRVEVGWGSLQEKLETGMIFFSVLAFFERIIIYAIEQLSLWAKVDRSHLA